MRNGEKNFTLNVFTVQLSVAFTNRQHSALFKELRSISVIRVYVDTLNRDFGVGRGKTSTK